MLGKCLSVVNISIIIMKVVVVWRRFFVHHRFPGTLRYTRDRSWWISLFVTSIVGIFFIDNFSDKCGSTLFLCLRISITHRRIRSHRDSFLYTLREDIGDDRFFARVAFFSFDDGCEYEAFVCGISERVIRFSDFFIEFSEKSIEDHVGIGSREDTIGIWVEKSFEGEPSFQK